MYTNERDGGNMSKKINKVIITPESIDIISIANGVNSVTQLGLEPQDNEIQSIFELYNLNAITNYPFDTKIVRALAENEEQLRDYLEACKFANISNKKMEISKNIPQIEYDFLQLKRSSIEPLQQLQMYREAKTTQQTFKKYKGQVFLKIGILDNGYYVIQDLLQNRKKNVQSLNPAEFTQRRNLREELRNPKLTARTNEVAKEYAHIITKTSAEKQEKVH